MVSASMALAMLCLATQPSAASPTSGEASALGGRPQATANDDTMQALKKPGTKFTLVDSAGKKHDASLVRIDDASVVLRSGKADYSIRVDQLQRLERPADRRWDGALIGFGVGLAMSALVSVGAAEASLLTDTTPKSPHVGGMVAALMVGSTGLGYAIDAAHGKAHTLFIGTMPENHLARRSAVAIGPLASGFGRGVQASVRLTF